MAQKQTKQTIDKIGLVSSESVRKHTKRDWDQWVEILDGEGARHFTHKEIVALLKKKYKLSVWWQQWVASGFEVAIGRRMPGQNAKGEYSVTATKSMPVDAKRTWKLLADNTDLWLQPMSEFKFKPGNVFETDNGVWGEIRTMQSGRRIRMTWNDSEWMKPSVLQIHVVSRPKQKSILVFTHEKLASARFRNQMRDHWKNVLQKIFEAV